MKEDVNSIEYKYFQYSPAGSSLAESSFFSSETPDDEDCPEKKYKGAEFFSGQSSSSEFLFANYFRLALRSCICFPGFGRARLSSNCVFWLGPGFKDSAFFFFSTTPSSFFSEKSS